VSAPAVLAAAVCFGALLLASFGPSFSTRENGTERSKASVIRLAVSDVPGFLHGVDPAITSNSTNWLAHVGMLEPEKQRLTDTLRDGRLRLGAVTLWDTVHQDGDRVRISSSGFSQEVTILHAPKVFFVPYLPGSSVRLEAIHDGGGGVTLGVRTALGDMPLPWLSVGQVLEIALP